VNDEDLLQTKQQVRRALRAARAAMPAEQRQSESASIATRVLALPEVINAHSVHIYLSMKTEVDTNAIIRALISSGKQVVVPWMNEDGSMSPSELLLEDLDNIVELGKLRVPQAPHHRPVEDGRWDLVIVPLVGATLTGERIGNGAGHYDRLLSTWPRTSVGLALSAQIVLALPLEPHDIRLTHLITATPKIRA
jgi:5-formyltetrahydrofolate cyclo-ligase